METLRDLEEQNARLDPMARSLLLILHREPEAALRALGPQTSEHDQAAD